MIVVQHFKQMNDPNSGYEPERILVHLSEESIVQMQTILNRALNCIPPEDPQWKDWFELSDRLEKIV
jgi:hypothetical protein